MSDEGLDFIDVFTPMLGNDGKPRPDLFVADKLHMNETGYKVWTLLIRGRLNERARPRNSNGQRPRILESGDGLYPGESPSFACRTTDQ